MSMDDQLCIPKLEEDEVKPEFLIDKEESMESRKRNLEEEEPINFSKKGVSTLTKCCVCGKMNQKCHMTIAPKQEQVLLKWSQVFGSEFLVTCQKSSSDQFICAIHWEQLRDDWEGPLPEVLEKMKKKNNGSFKAMMILKNIDEDGNAHFQKFEKCRYCNCSREKDDMVLVPNDPLLSRWVDKLGLEFHNNLETNSTNYICWTHIKLPYRLKPAYLKFLPGPPARSEPPPILTLPSTARIIFPPKNKKIKKEKKEEVVNEERPRWNKLDWRLECRYCGARRVRQYMIDVPNNEKQLLKWAKILGQQFLENVQKHTKNQICWNHFENPEKYVSSISTHIDADNLPIADGMINEELNNKEVKEMENEEKPDLGMLKQDEKI